MSRRVAFGKDPYHSSVAGQGVALRGRDRSPPAFAWRQTERILSVVGRRSRRARFLLLAVTVLFPPVVSRLPVPSQGFSL